MTPAASDTSRGSRAVDATLALALVAGYVALLLGTTSDLGYARDEGFYFQAAASYERWFELLWRSPSEALERAAVDRFWAANHEHPPLMKGLFALSHALFFEKWRVFSEAGTAYRFPGMAVSALALGIVYLWGRRTAGRLAAVCAAISLGFMPRVFYHAHLDCFDVPVASMWLLTTWAYWRSLNGGGLRWAVASGVCYGLFLATKHNAWLFPGVVVAHVLVHRWRSLARGMTTGRLAVPAALPAMLVLGPIVLWLLWPWLWFDTGARLAGWVAFHTHHDFYNMEFLGETYWKPPMPRLYAWGMTLATVPTITLVLSGIGGAHAVRTALLPQLARRFVALRGLARGVDPSPHSATYSLWALSILVSYAPWLSSGTPIFGGTKHWITAYPFLCLFAAHGLRRAADGLAAFAPAAVRRWRAVELAVAVAVCVGPVVMALHAHPWGLSAYVPLVGGAPGAASLGLNRGFWGYQTGAMLPFVNERAPRGAQVYLHDTALASWDMLRRDGRARADLAGTLDLSRSSVGVYHHEQHMARVEHQLWVDYGTTAPAHLGLLDGVPIVWVYVRPTPR
ncbi:MAG: glycosyltransferase family 39 protein [Polyangiaceae bacterium]|nr:glycosyltransferase family 39 protein [Polyangiaceae bacterium]